MGMVIGVDGCRGGWVAAVLTENDARGPAAVRWSRADNIAAITAMAAGAIGIDIPVGLPDGGPRTCDVVARRLLGRRASCVFPAPVRAVLAARSYAEACAVSRQAQGTGLSRQSWNLVGRIADTDRLLRSRPDLSASTIEVHPEVSFLFLTGRILPPKRTAEGALARGDALSEGLRVEIARALDQRPRGVAVHDALDALVAAWSARRWLHGTAVVLPRDPPRDAAGLSMRIVA